MIFPGGGFTLLRGAPEAWVNLSSAGAPPTAPLRFAPAGERPSSALSSSFVCLLPPPHDLLLGERAQGASERDRRSGLGLTGPGGRSLRLLRRQGWTVGPYPPPPRRLRSLARAATRQAAAPPLAPAIALRGLRALALPGLLRPGGEELCHCTASPRRSAPSGQSSSLALLVMNPSSTPARTTQCPNREARTGP